MRKAAFIAAVLAVAYQTPALAQLVSRVEAWPTPGAEGYTCVGTCYLRGEKQITFHCGGHIHEVCAVDCDKNGLPLKRCLRYH